jgi:hypothetical protein
MILFWFWTAIHTKSMKTLLGSHLWCILEGSYNNLTSSLLGNGDGKASRGTTRPKVYTFFGVLGQTLAEA